MTRVAGAAAAGVVLAQVAVRALTAWPPGGAARWRRPNFRGAEVTLAAGPALALAAAATTTVPGAIAGLGSGLVGAYDDVVGARVAAKGFRGHVVALRGGTLSSGVVKVLGISTLGLLAASRLPPRRPVDVALGGAVVAGTANLVNLLDLRPGRALKVGLVTAVALREPGVAGSVAALLPADLREQAMLGDAGANALGAVLGVALAARLQSTGARVAALGGLGALTALSEVVSFSAVIDASPPLRWLDALGRRP